MMSGLQDLCRTLETVNRDAENLAAELGQRAQRLAQSASQAATVGTGSKRVEGAQTAQALRAASSSAQQAAQLLHHVAVEGRGFVSRHAGAHAGLGTGNANAPYSGQLGNAGAGSAGASGPGVEPRKLPVTSQGFHAQNVNGKSLQVFDHPIRSASTAVINQGSALPNSFLGTCGPCAVGTICRKAGVPADEYAVTNFAAINGLCTKGRMDLGKNGGTSASELVSILEGYGGISAASSIGHSMNDLAQYVEKGRGVIIGVNPYQLTDAGYGPQPQSDRAGHWIVLQSVARDPVTNDIVGFYLLDSNGTTISDTCLYQSMTDIGRAFTSDGSCAIVTDDTIW